MGAYIAHITELFITLFIVSTLINFTIEYVEETHTLGKIQ
jgi:hypothetical protein